MGGYAELAATHRLGLLAQEVVQAVQWLDTWQRELDAGQLRLMVALGAKSSLVTRMPPQQYGW